MALSQEAFFDRGVGGLQLEALVADFRRMLLRQERSPDTLRTYEFGWRSFLRYLHRQGVTRVEQLRPDAVEGWQDHLRLKPRSKAVASTAVRGLLTHAARQGLVEYRLVLAVAQVRTRRGLPRPIPPEDLERVAIILNRRRELASVTGLRNRALFWYVLTTGARVSEALQVTRLDFTRAYVIQKGGSEKLLLCPPTVLGMIGEYLAARDDNLRWLWVTHSSNRLINRLNSKAVGEIWKQLARRARIRRFTTHQIRHTDATELLAADIPAPAIAEHLGHRDLRTLLNYAQVDTRQRQQVVDAMDRLVRRQGRRPS